MHMHVHNYIESSVCRICIGACVSQVSALLSVWSLDQLIKNQTVNTIRWNIQLNVLRTIRIYYPTRSFMHNGMSFTSKVFERRLLLCRITWQMPIALIYALLIGYISTTIYTV